MSLLGTTYVFPLEDPTPVTLLRSIERITVGGLPKSGSVTTFVLSCAFPEKLTLSSGALTMPLTVTRALVAVVVVVEDVEVAVVVAAEREACAPAGELAIAADTRAASDST